MNSKCEDAQTQGIDLDISSEKDFAIQPASEKYRFFIKLIEKISISSAGASARRLPRAAGIRKVSIFN